MPKALRGVLPTSTGSEVNRLSRKDGDPINNGNMEELLSTRGVEYIRTVIRNNVRAGCTLGVASTFRVTPFRAHETKDWSKPAEGLVLPKQYRDWTTALVEISREEYGDRPLLGNICPTTDTSPGTDDQTYATVGNASDRIEFARRLHQPQIDALADEGITAIQVEACRHPDDAIAIAQAARSRREIQNLLISFEAEDGGLPDPIEKRHGYNFAEMKQDLQAEAGEDVHVQIGVNCIGATRVSRLLELGHQLDAVYPNQSDPGSLPDQIKLLRTQINESPNEEVLRHHVRSVLAGAEFTDSHQDTVKAITSVIDQAEDAKLRDALHEELDRATSTSIRSFQSVWQKSLQSGSDIVGVCCGGRPGHVRQARKEFDAQFVHA